MGGQLVILPANGSSKGHALQIELKKGVEVVWTGTYRNAEHYSTFTKLPAAFHLPEVCRQI
jgi:hypothetical protein